MNGEISRRGILAAGGALTASLATGVANARIRPQDMVPLIGPGYRPTDADEKGLWQQVERVEEEIAGSNLVIKGSGVDGYVRDLIGKVGGPAARDMRIYVVRVPEFNAMMFPTGFAVVFSGLILRMRNEAHLTGVIAHESAHFLRRHMIRQWRDMKRKSDLFAIGSLALGIGGAGAGVYTGDIAQLAQFGAILSLLRYSRELEAEADAMGARLMADAGYPPVEMANTWQQLIGELDLSAKYRRKPRERDLSLFQTHPLPETRMRDLRITAAELMVPGRSYDSRRAQYLQAIAPIRQMILDDQVKLNDPGASQYVINTLAQDGWNGLLRFYEGEVWRLRNRPGDDIRAAQSYAVAVAYPDAPADAWRWHGLSLMKQGRTAEGRVVLSRYLTMNPTAPDAPYIRAMVG
ncbi:M48 family metalloprotease [Sphingomonas sinipercae]|uniref:M48 family metalloprotease n=1 Tax=Sphingomonas sinipercae TaxID=2714944 RepID=A0A6G7ZNR7_9SPHN|nr:M48 family metallopeptidase [Sphingomonas sinipercae]QIL02568.1 M48 family metalloprotease [Sphingomonas sinipercae]